MKIIEFFLLFHALNFCFTRRDFKSENTEKIWEKLFTGMILSEKCIKTEGLPELENYTYSVLGETLEHYSTKPKRFTPSMEGDKTALHRKVFLYLMLSLNSKKVTERRCPPPMEGVNFELNTYSGFRGRRSSP